MTVHLSNALHLMPANGVFLVWIFVVNLLQRKMSNIFFIHISISICEFHMQDCTMVWVDYFLFVIGRERWLVVVRNISNQMLFDLKLRKIPHIPSPVYPSPKMWINSFYVSYLFLSLQFTLLLSVSHSLPPFLGCLHKLLFHFLLSGSFFSFLVFLCCCWFGCCCCSRFGSFYSDELSKTIKYCSISHLLIPFANLHIWSLKSLVLCSHISFSISFYVRLRRYCWALTMFSICTCMFTCIRTSFSFTAISFRFIFLTYIKWMPHFIHRQIEREMADAHKWM